MYESGTRLAAEVATDVQAFFQQRSTPGTQARTFATRIRRNIRLAEAPSFGQSIFQYAPQSHGAEDYRQLAAEVLDSAANARAA
jgi:chromosome partitioning protein